MTPAEMVERFDIALAYLDQVHRALVVTNWVAGDPTFEAHSGLGGAIYTVQHARGVVKELGGDDES